MANVSSIGSFVPASILSYLTSVYADPDQKTHVRAPIRQTYESVVMFADVSGFTAMCEALSRGSGGNESLAHNLNNYFELLVKIMSSQGGDVFKYAGDAIIVLWPPSDDPKETLQIKARRAAQCALEIDELLQEAVMSEGVRLSVKVGIGVGEISILHIGGVYNRLEYIAIGDPLAQAFHAEHQAMKKEVVISPPAWEVIGEFFNAIPAPDGNHMYLRSPKEGKFLRKVNISKRAVQQNPEIWKGVQSYVPSFIVPFVSNNEDALWINELRPVSVLFVNLGIPEADLVKLSSHDSTMKDIERLHNIISQVQNSVYRYEGSLNKFLMDDKGATLIAIFGQPPLFHENDSARAVLAAVSIQQSLFALGLRVSIGITTGSAFCGVCGSRRRREYTVLGDTVNLSARLMQHATNCGSGILTDKITSQMASQQLKREDVAFYRIAEIMVKGKSMPIEIFQPRLSPTTVQQLSLEYVTEDVYCYAGRTEDGKFPMVGAVMQGHYAAFLQEISAFVDDKAGMSTRIVGDAGSGKSLLLSKVLRSTQDTHSKLLYVLSAGDAHNNSAPYSVMSSVVVKLCAAHPDQKPRRLIRALLKAENKEGGDATCDALNLFLPYDFEESDAVMVMTPEEVEAEAGKLVLALILAFAKKQAFLLVVEDAQWIDNASWVILDGLSAAIEADAAASPLFLLVLTRPMNITNRCAFNNSIPQAYTNYTTHSAHEVKLDRLSKADTDTLIKDCKLTDEQVQLVHERSTGNPLSALLMVKELKADAEFTGVPPAIGAILGSQLDKISRVKRFILKMCSIIDPYTMCKSLILKAYPLKLEEGEDVSEGLAELCMEGLLAECKRPVQVVAVPKAAPKRLARKSSGSLNITISSPPPSRKNSVIWPVDDTYYCFPHGCLRRVIAARLLKKAQAKLRTIIESKGGDVIPEEKKQDLEEIEEDEDQKDKVYRESVLEGVLSKRGGGKSVFSSHDFKPRYFVLFINGMRYYDKKENATKNPKGQISFGPHSTVCIDRREGHGKQFRVNPDNTADHGREYIILAADKDQANHWVTTISNVLVSRKTKVRNSTASRRVSRAPMRKSTGKSTKDFSTEFSHLGDLIEIDKVFDESVIEGYMLKTGHSVRSFKSRYFIMFQDKIMYYKSHTDLNPLGEVKLGPETVVSYTAENMGAHTGQEAEFTDRYIYITPYLGARMYEIIAQDIEQRTEWMEAITKSCQDMSDSKRSSKVSIHSLMEGELRKCGGAFRTWRKRYFILFSNELHWYQIGQQNEGKSSGNFELFRDSKCCYKHGVSFEIKPSPYAKTYELQSIDEQTARKWVDTINGQIKLQQVDAPKI